MERKDEKQGELTGKIWIEWMGFHQEKLRLWRKERLARHHAQYALMDHVFIAWKEITMKQQTRKQHVQQACRIGARFYLQRYFKRWKENTKLCQQFGDSIMDATFQQHQLIELERRISIHQHRVLYTVCRGWRQLTERKLQQELNRRRAVRFRYMRLLRKGFKAFEAFSQRRDNIEEHIQHRIIKRNESYKRIMFSVWLGFVKEKEYRQKQLSGAKLHHVRRLQKCVLDHLKKHVVMCQKEKRRQMTAIAYDHQRLVGRALESWKRFTSSARLYTHALERRLMEYQVKHVRVRQRLVLTAWDNYTRTQQTKRVLSAQVRGQYYVRTLKRVFHAWMIAASEKKWISMLRDRAEQQYKKNFCMTYFSWWKCKTKSIYRLRESTRRALINWKMTRERQMFVQWKQYVAGKHEHRERMHEAMEFRHGAIVRTGLRLWVTAATHLREQRIRRVTNTRIMDTARIWRRVQAIAFHWRWLVSQRKKSTSDKNDFRPRSWDLQKRRHALAMAEPDWTSGESRIPQIRPPRLVSGRHNDTEVSSTLSDFVMMPRSRPLPRRPVDLLFDPTIIMLHDSEQPVDDNSELTNSLSDLNLKYGFQFPLSTPPLDQHKERIIKNESLPAQTLQPKPREILETPSLPSESQSAQTVEKLEKRLLHWHTRREQWNQFRIQLEEFRKCLQEAITHGILTSIQSEQMHTRLEQMERQELKYQQQWQASKPELLVLARQLEHIRKTSVTP